MLRSLSLPAALFGLTLLLAPGVPLGAPASIASASTAPAAKPSHHVEIRYAQTSGALRRATIRVTPLRDGGESRWRSIQGLAVVYRTNKGLMTVRAPRVSASGTGASAEFMLPAPERIAAFLVRSRSGETHGYADDDPPADGGDQPPVDPPADPPGDGDPPKDGDGGGGGGGDDPPAENCTPSGPCSGIVDPWTCACDEEIRDPWGNEARSTRIMSFDI